jgi:predicted phage gp36 major capsid-like protein
VQYRALISQFFYGQTSLSMDMIDQLRIFSPGDAASLSLQPSQEVAYRDPATGIEYVAKNYGVESINPAVGFSTAKSVGSRMIQYANSLAQAAYEVASTDPTTGELTYVTDAQGNPVAKTETAAQDAATMLKSFTTSVDVVRQLTLFFGYGPL